MRRTTLNFVIDLIGLVDLLLLAATGSIMKWVLPPGSGGHGRGFRGGRGPGPVKEFLDLARHDWGDVHFVLSVLFLLLMLVHIVLHWTWIKTCAKSFVLPSRYNARTPKDEPSIH